MKLGLVGGATAVLLLLAVIIGYSTFFTVYQTCLLYTSRCV